MKTLIGIVGCRKSLKPLKGQENMKQHPTMYRLAKALAVDNGLRMISRTTGDVYDRSNPEPANMIVTGYCLSRYELCDLYKANGFRPANNKWLEHAGIWLNLRWIRVVPGLPDWFFFTDELANELVKVAESKSSGVVA